METPGHELYQTATDHAERLARIEARLENVLIRIDMLVSRAEFLPVKIIAYGLVAGVMSGFVAQLVFKWTGGL